MMADGFADASSPVVMTVMGGWEKLSEGKTFAVDLSDIIKAAHQIGKMAEENARYDPYKGGEGTDINDAGNAFSDVYVKIEEPTQASIVIPAIGGSQNSWNGKPVVAEFKTITGKQYPAAVSASDATGAQGAVGGISLCRTRHQHSAVRP